MTDTLSIRQQFTVAERQLLLKLINLFTKYPEVTWSCNQLAKRWDTCARAVQRLLVKLRSLGWINEARIRYREFVRTASETLLNLKEKIIASVAIQSRSSRDDSSLKTDRKSFEDERLGKVSKSPLYNKDKDNIDPNTYTGGSAYASEISPDDKLFVQEARGTGVVDDLTDQEILLAAQKVGKKSFSEQINQLHASLYRYRNAYKVFSLRGLLIKKFKLPRRWL